MRKRGEEESEGLGRQEEQKVRSEENGRRKKVKSLGGREKRI